MAQSLDMGGAIKRLRRAAGLTQRELATRLDIDATYVSHLEANRREPSLQLLKDMAAVLAVPPGLLMAIVMAIELPDAYRSDFMPVLDKLLDLAVVRQVQFHLDD